MRPALDAFEREALEQLQKIEERQVQIFSCTPWNQHNVTEFWTGDGWKFAVFVDSGDWDYLEWVEAPDGRRWDWCDGCGVKIEDASKVLMDWGPVNGELWTDAEIRPDPRPSTGH